MSQQDINVIPNKRIYPACGGFMFSCLCSNSQIQCYSNQNVREAFIFVNLILNQWEKKETKAMRTSRAERGWHNPTIINRLVKPEGTVIYFFYLTRTWWEKFWPNYLLFRKSCSRWDDGEATPAKPTIRNIEKCL